MADPERFVFNYKEVAEALIRHQGLHEGIWSVYMEFGLAGANAGPSEDQILPTAIVPVVKLGLMRVQKESALAVDAAVVNPKPVSAAT